MSKKSIYGESYEPISEEKAKSKEVTRKELKEQSTRNTRIRQLGQLLREARAENEKIKRRLREAESKVSKHQEIETELARLRRTLNLRR